jgi:hypothetical protein
VALPHVTVNLICTDGRIHIHANVRHVPSAETLQNDVFTERTWKRLLELGFRACYKAFKD